MSEMSERIRYLREKSQKSQAEFGRQFDVSREMVGQWERGESRPRQPKLEKMSDLYGVSLDWLSGKEPFSVPPSTAPIKNTVTSDVLGVDRRVVSFSQPSVVEPPSPALAFDYRTRPPAQRDLPIRGHARAGKMGLFIDQGNHWGFAMRPESLRDVPDAYAVRVVDDSMKPRFVAGNVLAIDPHRRPQPGDNVVVQLRDEQAFIKELVRRTEKAVICKQYNPEETVEYKESKILAIHMVVGIDFLER